MDAYNTKVWERKFWDAFSDGRDTRAYMQHLGVAIVNGADVELVFAVLAATNFVYPQTARVAYDAEGDGLPFPIEGPCGSPLFAACNPIPVFAARADAIVALLLRCRANPWEEHARHVCMGYKPFGQADRIGFSSETPLNAAIRTGRESTVRRLLQQGDAALVESAINRPGLRSCKLEMPEPRDEWRSALFTGMVYGLPSTVRTLLDHRADPQAVCFEFNIGGCGITVKPGAARMTNGPSPIANGGWVPQRLRQVMCSLLRDSLMRRRPRPSTTWVNAPIPFAEYRRITARCAAEPGVWWGFHEAWWPFDEALSTDGEDSYEESADGADDEDARMTSADGEDIDAYVIPDSPSSVASPIS